MGEHLPCLDSGCKEEQATKWLVERSPYFHDSNAHNAHSVGVASSSQDSDLVVGLRPGRTAWC